MAKTTQKPNVILLAVRCKGVQKITESGTYSSAHQSASDLLHAVAQPLLARGATLLEWNKEVLLAVFGLPSLAEDTAVHALAAAQESLKAVAALRIKAMAPAICLDAFRVNITHLKKDFSNGRKVMPGIKTLEALVAKLPADGKPLFGESLASVLPTRARWEKARGGKYVLFSVKALPRLAPPARVKALPGLGLDSVVDRIMAPRLEREKGGVAALEVRLQRRTGRDTAHLKKGWDSFLSDFAAYAADYASERGVEVPRRTKTQVTLVHRSVLDSGAAAQGAVAAALALSMRARELAERQGTQVRVFTTVASAQAPWGKIAPPKNPVLTKVFARLQGLKAHALSGYTVVDPDTAGSCGSDFTVVPGTAKDHAVVHDLDPVRVLQAEAGMGLLEGMTGRPAEVGHVRRALTRAREKGKGSVLSVTAEDGMGKTRLGLEAVGLARESGCQAFYGACDPDRPNAPFLPVKEVLYAMLGLTPFGGAADELDRLSEWLVRRVPVHADTLHKAFRILFHIPGKANPADAYVPRLKLGVMTKSILTYLEEEAARTPLLLVFDNLHLAIKDTLDLVSRIEQLTLRLPIIVVKTTVPSVRLPVGPGETRMTLKKLSQTQALKLAREILDARTLGGALGKFVTSQLEGEPRRICETLAEFRRSERIVATKDRWDFGKQRVKTPRIDRRAPRKLLIKGLSKGQCKVLEAAAYLGRSFSLAALRAMPVEAKRVDPALDELVGRGVIMPLATRGERAYVFPDRLLHTMVREGVEKARRKRFHRKSAEALRKALGPRLDEHIDRLVFHYREAGMKKELGETLIRGAVSAKGMAMAGLAEEYFSEAMAFFKDTPVYDAWLKFELGGLLAQTGRNDTALQMLTEALSRLGKGADIPEFDERIDGGDDLEDDDGEAEEEDEDSGHAGARL